jgi:hypothetical protein
MDDEVLEEEGGRCDAAGAGHFFCLSCVKRAAHEVIGKGQADSSGAGASAAAPGVVSQVPFKCLESSVECGAVFSEPVLRRALPGSVWRGYEQRRATAELRRAGLKDLEECPFCSFAIIMPDKANKVLQCQNPHCRKASCRLCRLASHIPLRCDEVENDHELAARKAVEDRMTAALTITCKRKSCGKQFFKTEGCTHDLPVRCALLLRVRRESGPQKPIPALR